jgi:hypothetical protein
MTTELGRKLRKKAEDMAKSPDGTSMAYETIPDGTTKNAIKDRDGGQNAGLFYALKALGARKSRGDEITEDEIQTLIEKAKVIGTDYPEKTVRLEIENERLITNASDRFYKKK